MSIYSADDLLPQPFERAIRALLEQEWPGPNSTDADEPLTERALNPTYFLVVEENAVRSFARTIWARVTYCGQNLKLYGLGDVVTVQAQRRKGYGALVTQAATAHIQSASDADAALLLTQPGLERFYARWGWAHTPELQVVTQEADAKSSFAMMLFCSDRARQLCRHFAETPLILPGDEW